MASKKKVNTTKKTSTKKDDAKANAVLALRSFHGNAEDAERVVDAIVEIVKAS